MDSRNRTACVMGAECLFLDVSGERNRWLGGAQLREQLHHRAADPGLARELDELAGQILDEPE